MSTYKALAAVTKTLMYLIEHNKASGFSQFPFEVVSYHPEYFVDHFKSEDVVNIYLYHVKENPNLKHLDLPHRNSGNYNKTANPYLSLDLFYAISTNSESQLRSDLMLGYAMLKLFENPLISKEFLSTSIQTVHNPGAIDLTDTKIADDNIELLKIAIDNLSLDEISKIWGMFGIKHRTSAFYKISAVLMREEKQFEKGLPVKESTITVMAHNKAQIETIENKNGKKTFIDGDTMLIQGLNLQAESTYLVLDGDSANGIQLSTSDPEKLVSGNQITLKLQGIEAGIHAIQVYHSLIIGKPATEHKGFSSNTFSFILAPQISNVSLNPGGILSFTVKPDIPPKRDFSIILNRIVTVAGDTGMREFKLDIPNNFAAPQTFINIPTNQLNLPVGDYLVRFKINNAISAFADDYQSPKISVV